MESGNKWALGIGMGIALAPIHNVWLTDLLSNEKGEVIFFLPAFGYLLIIMGSGLYLVNKWQKIDWGDRKVAVPLLVIVASMGLSGIVLEGASKAAPLGMGLSLLALYLVSKAVGKNIFIPLGVGSIIASLGVIAYSFVYPGQYSGGFVFERNYDVFTGYALMGAALFVNRYQWLLAGLVIVSLFLSGSPEALLPVGVLAVAFVIRKDWSRKLIYVLAPLAIVAVIIFSTGSSLYEYTIGIFRSEHTVQFNMRGEQISESPLTWRLDTISRAMGDIKPLGIGYGATNFTIDTVHNVPLILVQQMGYPGIIASLAWLWVTFYCLFKTRMKYAWLLVISLSVFDHYIWTQIGPVWWALVGVSASYKEGDLVFRKV